MWLVLLGRFSVRISVLLLYPSSFKHLVDGSNDFFSRGKLVVVSHFRRAASEETECFEHY